MLGKNFSRRHLKYIFFCFAESRLYDFMQMVSSWETICMKCQILFSAKKKKKKKKRKEIICRESICMKCQRLLSGTGKQILTFHADHFHEMSKLILCQKKRNKNILGDLLYEISKLTFWNWKIGFITKTRLYSFDPLKPHFNTGKLGFTGVYIIFLISAQKHRLWVLVRTASPRRF